MLVHKKSANISIFVLIASVNLPFCEALVSSDVQFFVMKHFVLVVFLNFKNARHGFESMALKTGSLMFSVTETSLLFSRINYLKSLLFQI